jgi:GT2 family glycosyltransferase
MNKKIIYISDFFLEHIVGGAELNDNELLSIFDANNFKVFKIQSHDVTKHFLLDNTEAFYIISNFMNLSEESKQFIQNNLNYLIYEHDHKYLKGRNPARYNNFIAPLSKVINFYFYKGAAAILCQSDFHKKIMEDNLKIKNIISIGGNLWSLEILEFLRNLSSKEKEDGFSILDSSIEHKNTLGAISYCQKKKEKYVLVKSQDYKHFLTLLAKRKKFIFLPKTPETLSRVIVEARMLGCTVLTNSLVGASSEKWFGLKGEELIDFMIAKREEILSVIKDIIGRSTKKKKAPLVSIFTTFHEGKPFLQHFMKNIVKQTMFNECELIIIDANSQSDEQELIQEYVRKYDNIRYRRIEEKLKPGPCINEALMMARGKYVTFSFIDDVKADFCIESLYNLIEQNPEADLVYGDVLETDKINENFEETQSKKLFSHSSFVFSRENMIKCLPGPMPLWKREIHQKNGFFNTEEYDYSDDWEMWLRTVNNGSIFKKLDKIVGLYYTGGRSRQEMNFEQRKEEAKLFYTYSHIFGETNCRKYNQYFKQFT